MIMRIPEKIAGLRPLTILLAVYFVVWIVLEGDLTQTVVLGVGAVWSRPQTYGNGGVAAANYHVDSGCC